ncbi:unnamed protein product [Moneuplotes crassus]|uniref:Uncharacterized protein n=1 Tax=Euplotes crassus TaxID=5936 RepID=A0AAD1XHY6_EUPCR|nr:unnamed protein product [Moneuplotes crassus]
MNLYVQTNQEFPQNGVTLDQNMCQCDLKQHLNFQALQYGQIDPGVVQNDQPMSYYYPSYPMLPLNSVTQELNEQTKTDLSKQKRRNRTRKDFPLPLVLNKDSTNSSDCSKLQKEPTTRVNHNELMLDQNSHYEVPFKNLANEFRKSHKGRKRKCYLEAKNVKEFMLDFVKPQWEAHLKCLSDRERNLGIMNKGSKYVWTQLLKDIQKFYRLMFRLRFHRCDKRNDGNQEVIIDSILGELGMRCSGYDAKEVFQYFYSVLTKLRKSKNSESEEFTKTFTKVFEDDSRENIEAFINHELSRKFLKFFILNFGEDYIERMNGSFKKEVREAIGYLANEYGLPNSLHYNY